MPGLYARDTGGVARKYRELHEAQGGVDRKLREMYARDTQGVERKIFTSNGCQVQIIRDNEGIRRSEIYASGRGKIGIYSTYWGSDPAYYETSMIFKFDTPVAYTAATRNDYFGNRAAASSLIKFANPVYQSAAWRWNTTKIFLYDRYKSNPIGEHFQSDTPYISNLLDYGLWIDHAGLSDSFELTFSATLEAREDEDAEAYLKWDGITFCGIPLTGIEVV